MSGVFDAYRGPPILSGSFLGNLVDEVADRLRGDVRRLAGDLAQHASIAVAHYVVKLSKVGNLRRFSSEGVLVNVLRRRCRDLGRVREQEGIPGSGAEDMEYARQFLVGDCAYQYLKSFEALRAA